MPIRVEGKDMYMWTHGSAPRGHGHWAFRIGGDTKSFSGTFTEAQKKAIAYARKHHPRVVAIKLLT